MPRFAVSLLILSAILTATTHAEPIDPTDIRVIDGDTIRINRTKPDVRLVGFNAPETRRATCPAEREHGAQATRRLRVLVFAGNPRERLAVTSAGASEL